MAERTMALAIKSRTKRMKTRSEMARTCPRLQFGAVFDSLMLSRWSHVESIQMDAKLFPHGVPPIMPSATLVGVVGICQLPVSLPGQVPAHWARRGRSHGTGVIWYVRPSDWKIMRQKHMESIKL